MSTLCAGAVIPSWGSTGHWGQATCQAGTYDASVIGVTEETGLEVTDGAGTGVTGVGMDGPGGLGVNPPRRWTWTGIWGAGAG